MSAPPSISSSSSFSATLASCFPPDLVVDSYSSSRSQLDHFRRLIRFLDKNNVIHYGDLSIDSSTNQYSIRCIEGDPLSQDYKLGDVIEISSIEKLLSPIQPSYIYAIGMNYKSHAQEVGAAISTYPVVFAKSNSSLCHPFDNIILPYIPQVPYESSDSKSSSYNYSNLGVDFEVELAIVLGKTIKNMAESEVYSSGCILGYSVANDVTARYYQFPSKEMNISTSQWHKSKSFDSFCPLGPCIISPSVIPNPHTLRLSTILNGTVVQDSNTSDLIFSVPKLIAFLSAGTTLERGTVILTGTPSGIGHTRKPPLYLKAADTVSVQIEKIGKLTNTVKNEK